MGFQASRVLAEFTPEKDEGLGGELVEAARGDDKEEEKDGLQCPPKEDGLICPEKRRAAMSQSEMRLALRGPRRPGCDGTGSVV